MDKSEIEKLNQQAVILKSIISNFNFAKYDFKNGKNQKVRTEGYRRMQNEMDLAKDLVTQNKIAYKIASGGEREETFYRKEYLADSFKESFFARDMQIVIKQIENLINS